MVMTRTYIILHKIFVESLYECISYRLQHSEDSWSEEEGEVSEEDSDARNRRPRSYCSTLSSEGVFSEEENTSEYSTSCKTPDGLLSTNSSENLHLELEKCVLPERYTHHQVKTAQKLRHKAANQPILFEVCFH